MKFAGVYSRAGKVFVYSFHKTLAGAHLAQDDAIALDADDLEGIGSAVRAALDAYREGVPMPPREALVGERLTLLNAAAGVHSSREFMKGAKKLSIRWDNNEITLTPWKNEGARDNFVALKGCDRIIPDTSPDLGAAVIAALADAE